MNFNSKLPNIKESIFATMTKLSIEHNAINLSQGFPSFNCSEELIELVHKFQLIGMNQYAQMPGLLSLREEISRKTEKLYNRKYDPVSEITITSGATQAIFTAINTFIHVDDEVIILEPAYDSYLPSILLNGGIPVPIFMDPNDFSINWSDVKKKISAKTKMIVINTPHNPSGSIWEENDIKELEEITSKSNLLILSDEVYEHIIFDGRQHHSICKYPQLADRAIVINSFGKTFHTTGWKVGYVLAPRYLTDEFRKVHQFTVFAVNTPVQYAYAEYLKDENHYLSLPKFYQAKRDFVLNLLNGSKFKPFNCSGTYFILLDYSSISNESDIEFAIRLTKKAGVAVIPLSPFYSFTVKLKIIRICFAKTDEILESGVERLLDFANKN
jgi:methionine aminotransferase